MPAQTAEVRQKEVAGPKKVSFKSMLIGMFNWISDLVNEVKMTVGVWEKKKKILTFSELTFPLSVFLQIYSNREHVPADSTDFNALPFVVI